MDHAADVRRVGRCGLDGIALLLIQHRDHVLRQAVHLGDMLCGQAGVLTGDHQPDIFLLQHGKAPGHIAPAHILQHEHCVQIAGDCQIQDLQFPVFGVLRLVLFIRQRDALLLQIAAGADEDAVIIAPAREAQSPMLFQILDREQDVGTVLDDLAEQAPQSTVGLVEHTGRVQDRTVDAAALEDADILQLCAVGGEQVVGVDLQRIDAAQLLNGLPAGHHRTHSRSSALQPQRCNARDEGGRQRCTHAQHCGHGCNGLVPPGSCQQEQHTAEQGNAQQNVRDLAGTALAGTLAQALLHKAFGILHRAAQQHPWILLFQIPCQRTQQVLIFGAESALMLHAIGHQLIPALDRCQHHPAAQQGKEQAQRRHAAEQRNARGAAVDIGVQHCRHGLQQRRRCSQSRHRIGRGTPAQAGQAVPQDREAHAQACRQQQQVCAVECRRSCIRVQRGHRGQQPVRHQTKVQQHHGQNAAQYAAQRQLGAHAVQLFRCRLRALQLALRLLSQRRRLPGFRLLFRLRRCLCLCLRLCCRGFAVQRQQRQAHGVLFCSGRICRGRGGLRLFFVLCMAKEIDHRLFAFRSRFFLRLQVGIRFLHRRKHSSGQRRAAFFFFTFRSSFRLRCRGCFLCLCRPGRHGCAGSGLFLAQAIDHGLELSHFLLLLFLLRQKHLRCILGAAGGFCRTALPGRLCHRGCALSGRLRLLCRSRGREIHPERFCILRFRLQKGPRGQLLLRVCRRLQHQFQICFLLRLGIPAQHHLTGGHFLRLCCRGFLLICLAAGKQAKPLLRLFLRQFLIPPGHFFRDVHRRGAEKRAELFILGHCLIVIFILRHSCPSCKYR